MLQTFTLVGDQFIIFRDPDSVSFAVLESPKKERFVFLTRGFDKIEYFANYCRPEDKLIVAFEDKDTLLDGFSSEVVTEIRSEIRELSRQYGIENRQDWKVGTVLTKTTHVHVKLWRKLTSPFK